LDKKEMKSYEMDQEDWEEPPQLECLIKTK
jgi:hypothetical protein